MVCNKVILCLYDLHLFTVALCCRICFCSYIKVITYLMLHKAPPCTVLLQRVLFLREAHILNMGATEISLISLFPSLPRKH
jgi:hypothetical protein